MTERFVRIARHCHIRWLHLASHLEEGARRLRGRLEEEAGQTSTEYLMIVGLMAAVILLAFVTFFWGTVKGAAQTWATKVHDAILGNQVTG